MGTVLLTGWREGEALRSAQRDRPHAPAYWWSAGTGVRRRDPCREILRLKDRLREIIAETTGQPYDRVARDSDRDFYMNAQEAMEYGIVDGIVSSMPML